MLIINAIMSIMLGGFCFIGIFFLYFMYGSSLCALTVERHPDTYWFVLAFKLFFLMFCPGLCALLIILGSHILFYLKKSNVRQ
jgi:hypothetical protein